MGVTTIESTFLHHEPCEGCGSSDGVSRWSDGHGYCHVCETYYHSDGYVIRETSELSEEQLKGDVTPVTDVFRAIPRRGLPEEAIKKYGIDVCMDKTLDVAHRYPYYKDGKHIANKVRKRTTKAFYWEGNPKDAELFGQHLLPSVSSSQRQRHLLPMMSSFSSTRVTSSLMPSSTATSRTFRNRKDFNAT